ncbi:unnamed protein product [Durusdinium trenchii]|uniref:Uncharacterized protein n=1 Tax=Durusdinium trenchii TaxID=1381693 RepID=A0ABP0PWX1_9DINO
MLCAASALSADISEQEFDIAVALNTGVIFGLQDSSLLRIDTLTGNVHTELHNHDKLCGWPQLLEANGDLWAVPCAAHHVLKISQVSGASKVSIDDLGTAFCKWRHAAQGANGLIYAMPWQAPAVLRIDPVSSAVSSLGHLAVTSKGKFGFTVKADEYVCGIPWAARMVLCIDTRTDETMQFGDFSDLEGKWRTAAANNQGIIFALPVEADSVLRIDPKARSVRELEHIPTGRFKPILLSRWAGGLAVDSWLVALPGFDCSTLQVDMVREEVRTHELVCQGNTLHSWHSAVVAENGAIYAVPFSATAALKINFQGASTQVIQLGDFGNGLGKWGHAVLSHTGDVYGVPWSAEKVLKIRPQNDQVTTFGNFEPGPARWKLQMASAYFRVY